MDEFIRKEIKKIFPDNPLTEIPSNHILFQEPFNFPNGLPKIHEHDNQKPQAFESLLKEELFYFILTKLI